MNDILITYGWVRSSYNALRNLSKHNVSVIASDSSNLGMCQFSRLKKGFVKYTSHYKDENNFIKELQEICKAKNIKYIFPSHNETEVIARHRNKFDPSLVSLVPDYHHCKLFNNKSDSYDFVKSLGIPVPSRIKYSNPSSIAKTIEDSGITKTVIKLLTGNSSKGVFYSNSPKHAQALVKDLITKHCLDSSRYPQIEEYVEGEGYGCSVLYWKGKFIADFTHRRLRDKIETGGTSTFREVAKHDGIEKAARTIFNTIGWNGLAMSEFKVCPKTGRFWFIEINPRMWGSIPLAIESGVEFPYLAWLCASENPERAINYYKECKKLNNWKARWLLGDVFVVTNNILNLNFKSPLTIFFKEKANSIDDFFWDDPLVFFGQLLAYIKNTISKRSINPSEKGMIR